MLRIVLVCLAALAGADVSSASIDQTMGRPGGNADRLYTPVELRADFEQLYHGLQEAHFDLYAFTPKPRLDRLYAQQLTALDRPLTRQQARTRFELFAAAVRMGHTRVDSPDAAWLRYLQSGGKSFPLPVRIVAGRVYVAQNLSGVEAIRPGEEILGLNGESMSRWLERTDRHVSAETDYMAHSLMEYDFAQYLWVELGAVDGFDIRLRRAGSALQVHVPARTQAQMESQHARQPPVLDLENPLRTARLLSEGVAYLRPGPFYNTEARTAAGEWDVSGFRQFIDHAFATFATAHADRLIIDLRGNPGGDNLFSDLMVAWFASRPFRFASQFRVKVSRESIAANDARMAHDAQAAGPISHRYADLYAHARIGEVVDFDIPETVPRAGQRFTGKVFVLVDRQTYSNAVAVAALIQDYHFGVVLGEPTSDMASTYGAMEQFTLHNTELMVGYPKARIIRPDGDTRPRGVTPDVLIDIPVVQAPDDLVLAQAVVIARRR